MRIFCSTCQLWCKYEHFCKCVNWVLPTLYKNCLCCFSNQFLLITYIWEQVISNFLREIDIAETWENSILFWGKLFTIHRKGCDLVKISWAFAVNLPEFLHRDSWKPPIRWTPLFTAECVWLADVFDHLILPAFWSWYILFRSNLFFSFNII